MKNAVVRLEGAEALAAASWAVGLIGPGKAPVDNWDTLPSEPNPALTGLRSDG